MKYVGLIYLLLLCACSNPHINIDKPVTAIVHIEMVDGYITDCGVPIAIGCARKLSNNLYKVEISKQSPSHEETLRHEMWHVGRWMTGLPTKWSGHP
jgi:hypothetical protein